MRPLEDPLVAHKQSSSLSAVRCAWKPIWFQLGSRAHTHRQASGRQLPEGRRVATSLSACACPRAGAPEAKLIDHLAPARAGSLDLERRAHLCLMQRSRVQLLSFAAGSLSGHFPAATTLRRRWRKLAQLCSTLNRLRLRLRRRIPSTRTKRLTEATCRPLCTQTSLHTSLPGARQPLTWPTRTR